VPEFGLGSQTTNPVFGATRNAWDPSRTAGGSSGGAAVALALRMLPAADGSDMGGSLRNPAGWANVVGFRPSPGVVPSGPAPEAFLGGLSVEGPMARTVGDAALLLSVFAGRDPRDPRSVELDAERFAGPLDADQRGVRVAWVGDWDGHLPTEPGVLELCSAALGALESLGCRVERALPPFPAEELWQAWVTLRHWLAGSALAIHAHRAQTWALLKPEAQWEVEGMRRLSALDVFRASEVRTAWHGALLAFFARYDAIAAPTAQVFPFPVELLWPREIAGRALDTYHRWMEVVVPWTMAGCPVAAVPAGFDARGLPMGLQLVGPPGADLRVLELARAYERACGLAARRPPLLDAQPA
jgi:amidase